MRNSVRALEGSGCITAQTLFRTSEYPNLPTLEELADKTGKGNFFRLADYGLNGAYALDQAWHEGWETLAALLATTKATSR